MKKLFLIIGFLFLISCSSKEEQTSEKSQPEKQQETPALNLRPIEELGIQETQKTAAQLATEASHKKRGIVWDSVNGGWVHANRPSAAEQNASFERDVRHFMDSVRSSNK